MFVCSSVCKSSFNVQIGERVRDTTVSFLNKFSLASQVPFYQIKDSFLNVSQFQMNAVSNGAKLFLVLAQIYQGDISELQIGFENKFSYTLLCSEYLHLINSNIKYIPVENFVLCVSSAGNSTVINLSEMNEYGVPVKTFSNVSFDVTRSPWYLQMKMISQRAWLLALPNSKRILPSLYLSNPLFDPQNNLFIGGISTRIELSSLNSMLSNMGLGGKSCVFIIDKVSGVLIASSNTTLSAQVRDEILRRQISLPYN